MMKELEDGSVQPWGASMMFDVTLDVLNQIHRNWNHCQSPNHSCQGPDCHDTTDRGLTRLESFLD